MERNLRTTMSSRLLHLEPWLGDQTDDFYFKGIDCLKEKWAKCIKVKGDYIYTEK